MQLTRRNLLAVLPGVAVQPGPPAAQTLAGFIAFPPLSLMPGADPSPPAAMLRGKVTQGLLRLSDRLQPLPDLATGWTPDPDGHACIFDLPKNALFHDRARLTADDIGYALTYLKEHAPWAGFRWIDGVKPLEGHRVRISSAVRIEHLLPLLDGFYAPIVSARSDPAIGPIGTGPFQLPTRPNGADHGVLQLEANPEYWRAGLPRLRQLSYRIEPDPRACATALLAGKAQIGAWLDIAPPDAQHFTALPGWQVTERGWQTASPTCWLHLNHRNPKLADERVRRAIAMSVDRDDIAQRIWGGFARVLGGPLPAIFSAANPESPARDPAAASALLTDAGCMPDDEGVRLRLRVLELPWGPIWKRTLRSIRQSLSAIGVDIDIISVTRADWAAALADPDLDAALLTMPSGGSALQALASLYGGDNIRPLAGANLAGFRDRDVDRLIDKAAALPPGDAHHATLAELERLLTRLCPAIWLFEPRYHTIMPASLRNVTAFGSGVFSPFDYVAFQS